MANLKEKILKSLKNTKQIEPTLNTLSKSQENLLKNYSNPVFNKKDKNKILKSYSNLQDVGKSLYRYNTLQEHNYLNDAEDEKGNIENKVLKGGISYNKYVWHSENGEHTCDVCADLDGQEFEYYDEVPERPHPNCKCYVEIVEYEDENSAPETSENEEPCDCLDDLPTQFANLVDEAKRLQNNIKNMIKELFSKIKTRAGKLYEDTCQKILDEAATWDNAAGDFARNYNDMVSADTINADKYFHSKANCQATQRGGAGEVLAKAISLLRELEEGTRKVLFEGADLIEQIEDANRDMEANKYGREQGKMNPNEACEILIDILRPNGLPDKY